MRIHVFVVAALLLCAGVFDAVAQTTPTGTITGKVTDPDKLALPGVTVTATSAALQGSRTAVTTGNGDYVLPFLPAGDYTLAFELSGFGTLERKLRVQLAESAAVDVQLALAGVTETVQVNAPVAGDFTQTSSVAASYKQELLDQLPTERTLNAAVLLAPGTTDSGPGDNITFSGALAYEGLFLLNGVVINETLRNQPRGLYIEDAVEEVKTTSAAISAEFGRFSGGVANTITKSGSNAFSGSSRVTFRNDSWREVNPFERTLTTDPRVDTTVPTYELTFGGPVLRDRLWFFSAARFENNKASENLAFTDVPYEEGDDDKRYEIKGTWTLTPRHTFKTSYLKRDRAFTNNSFDVIMDRASLYDSTNPEQLVSTNYSGILTDNLFVEAQYSRRDLSFVGSGSQFTDIQRGTIILDLSRSNARWNSPTFCAVCGAEGGLNVEQRDNQNVVAKATWFLSTERTGSHNLVFGGDAFEDTRKNDNWQSGSGYRLYATNTILRGENLYPVVTPNRSYVQYNPIFESSRGSSLRTYSAFVNDQWTFNRNFSFNLGVRWDKTDAKDQAGNRVSDDQAFSPRLAATWDPRGDGTWTVNTGFARYAMGVASGIADLGSGAGRTGTFTYFYQAEPINADPNTPNPVAPHDALTRVFDWFFANGGTDRPLRSTPTYPGVNQIVGDNLITPSAWEATLGFTRKLGGRGSFRVDGIWREYRDFYATQRDLTTGRVPDPTGRQYDLAVVVNTNDVERDYKALQGQWQYLLFENLSLGGNYTLSQSRGNFNGETTNSGPDTADVLAYPQYRDPRWNAPVGDLSIDQRHKLRLWGNYQPRIAEGFGRLDLGVLQRVTSGAPSSVDALIDSRPYVTNPGYLTPPATVTYYFGPRGEVQADTLFATDLALNYAKRLGLARSEVFARFVVENLFNNAALREFDETVLTNRNDPTIAPFNPFTGDPALGTHYRLGERFGQALEGDDYQDSRRFHFAVGFRF